MRKAMLLKRVETKCNLQDDCEATFHQWGSVAIEGPNGCFTGDTIAVCEKADGTVVTPLPHMIRFLDTQPTAQPTDTCKWKRVKTQLGSPSCMVESPHDGNYQEGYKSYCPTCGKRIDVTE